jgi:predicted Holliday junction resolvase-like endonuclease
VLNSLLICAIVAIMVVLILVVLSCCKISGQSSRKDEELELQNKNSVLSDLEKQTLNELLQAFKEDGVNIANKKNIEQYEEEDE